MPKKDHRARDRIYFWLFSLDLFQFRWFQTNQNPVLLERYLLKKFYDDVPVPTTLRHRIKMSSPCIRSNKIIRPETTIILNCKAEWYCIFRQREKRGKSWGINNSKWRHLNFKLKEGIEKACNRHDEITNDAANFHQFDWFLDTRALSFLCSRCHVQFRHHITLIYQQ